MPKHSRRTNKNFQISLSPCRGGATELRAGHLGVRSPLGRRSRLQLRFPNRTVPLLNAHDRIRVMRDLKAEMNLRTPKILRIGEAQPNCVRGTLECGALWVGEADFSSAFQSHVIFVYAHLRIRMMRDLKAEMNLRTPKMLRIGEAQPGFAACAVSKLFARRLADRSDFRNSRSHSGATE